MPSNAQVRHVAFALVGIALLAALGLSFTGGRSHFATPDLPGEAAFRDAGQRVASHGPDGPAFGDLTLATALHERLNSLPQARDGEVRVHAQRGGPGTCFLIGLPERRLELEQRPPFLAAAWKHAVEVTGDGLVVVALRGKLTVSGVARGRAGEACEVVAGLAVVPTDLFPFFANDAAPVDSAH